MPVRTEMQEMINYTRQYGSAAADDVFNGVTYWSDQQLQDILDRHGATEMVLLRYQTKTSWGVMQPRHIWYPTNAVVVDSSEVAYSGSYTYNASFGEVLFSAAPATSSPLYLKGFRVNLWEALAELWAIKAQQRYDYVNFKGGNNKMDLETEKRTCEQMRDYYRARTIRRFPRITSRFA